MGLNIPDHIMSFFLCVHSDIVLVTRRSLYLYPKMLSGRHGELGQLALKLARKKSEKKEQGQELEAALRRLTKGRLVLSWKKSHQAELKQRRATMFAALEMESTRAGVAGRLARANQIQIKSRSALQKGVCLEYNPGSEAASHPLAMVSPVK